MHSYIDHALELRPTLKENLRRLTPQQFEQLLHPVFQAAQLCDDLKCDLNASKHT